MPSKMDMLKLMMDKEFREAAQKVGLASDIRLLDSLLEKCPNE